MDIIGKKARNYTPVDIRTRVSVCMRVRSGGWPIRKACGYYHVSRSSAYRWLRRWDGTEASLSDGSHRPHAPCPFAAPKHVVYKIACLAKQVARSGLTTVDVWVRARRQTGVPVSYSTVLRYLAKLGGVEPYRPAKKRRPKPYDTPSEVGEKWQMDVKFVPSECKSPKLHGDRSYFQYTVIDEASRKRFLYFSDEHTASEAAAALRMAVSFFGYAPKVVQTDNGLEFCDHPNANRQARPGASAFDAMASRLGISHKAIRPRTPRHNGKVERSHRTDQDRFYRTLRFHSLEDLRGQGARWMRRYNDTPKPVLGLRTPNEAELDSLARLLENTGEVRCLKMLKRLTSPDI